MDTTAAAELGMGSTGELEEDIGDWNVEEWQEQDYEYVHAVGVSESINPSSNGEVNEQKLSATGNDRSGPAGRPGRPIHGRSESGRPDPSGAEPPQKRIRTAVPHRQRGRVQENRVDNVEEQYGYGGQVHDYHEGQNFNSSNWYGAESATGFGYPGDGAWHPRYGPGIALQHQMMDPRMVPSFYFDPMNYVQAGHNPMNYVQAGQMNFYGTALPTPGEGAGGSGMGKGNTARIFYKTKLCSKFKAGACTFDGHCNFAHGAAELRNPPSGWDNFPLAQNQKWGRDSHAYASNQSDGRSQKGRSDLQKPHKRRPCKNYFSDGVCPYGDSCSFLHEVEGMQPRAIRGSSHRVAGRVPGLGRRGGRGGRGSSSSLSWKTQMCRRWETTGECHFGENCRFAHGTAGLIVSGDMKTSNDGPVTMYEEWGDGNEWEAQILERIRSQPTQVPENDYPGNELYPGEKYDVQYFQRPHQDLPYDYTANNQNGTLNHISSKRTGVRGTAKNVNAEPLDEEEEYYELDGDHQESYTLHE